MTPPTLRWRCTIERETESDPAYGGRAAFVPVAVNVPCHWWVSSGREAVGADRTVVLSDEQLMLGLDVDVAAGDRVTELIDHRGRVVFTVPEYREVEHVGRARNHLDISLRGSG